MNALLLILLPILITVESSGNDYAIGDGGAARGCLQIHRCCLVDGTAALGVKWSYEEGSFDRAKSVAVAGGYLGKYGRRYERITGKAPTFEVLARIHNGGPDGWRKPETLKYWERVKKWIGPGE